MTSWIEISQNAETGEWSYLRVVAERIVSWGDGFPTHGDALVAAVLEGRA